jgi:hypothetical protein
MSSLKMDKTPEDFWWGNVSGPSMFVRETVRVLSDGHHACLLAPQGLPWRDAFYAQVRDGLREFENELLFEDALATAEDPGLHLIKNFGLEPAYRPTKPSAEFLRDRRVLVGKVIRVKTKGMETTQRWLLFEKGYQPTSIKGGLVLMETDTRAVQTVPPSSWPQYVRLLDYDDFISEYDALVFAGLLLPYDLRETEQKRYLATLAVSLLGLDPVRVAEFVYNFRFGRDDPERWIWSSPQPDELPRRVWAAQVQTLFPLIMREGREFIQRWRSQIEDAFDYASRELSYEILDSNQATVNSPEELEIGTLRFMMHRKRLGGEGSVNSSDYLLYIPDEHARDRLELLWAMRNRLAHGKVCSTEEVEQLLTIHAPALG